MEVMQYSKKRYSSFLKRVCIFQKQCFKVEILKTLEISGDCHQKNMPISKAEGYFKNPLAVFFRRPYALSVSFQMKPLRKSVFLCQDKNQRKFCRKPC